MSLTPVDCAGVNGVGHGRRQIILAWVWWGSEPPEEVDLLVVDPG